MKRKPKINEVLPVSGWVLITREESDYETDEDRGPWNIAWMDVFGTKHSALAFASTNRWQRPYRAVRGFIHISEPRQ